MALIRDVSEDVGSLRKPAVLLLTTVIRPGCLILDCLENSVHTSNKHTMDRLSCFCFVFCVKYLNFIVGGGFINHDSISLSIEKNYPK